MTPRITLPEPFSERPFSVAPALGVGLSRGRLEGADLMTPLRGVRSSRSIESRAAYIRAAATRMRSWQVVAGSSAAVLWGLPLPARLTRRLDAVVLVATEHGRPVPEATAFRGIRLSGDRLVRDLVDGVAVTDPIATWCLLSRELTRNELVAVGDCLVTASARYEHRHPSLPVLGAEDLVVAHERWGRSPGSRVRSQALARIRPGVDSPMESELRCAILDAGLPEPTIHPPVRLRSGRIVHPDLGYVRERIAIEYEGRRHRETERFDRDIVRREEFEEVGWRVVRCTSAHLRPDPRAVTARVARAREQRLAE